jgi:hypothetical protein
LWIEDAPRASAMTPDFREPRPFYRGMTLGDNCRATAIRAFAGSTSSFTRMAIGSLELTFGLAKVLTKILSVRTVLWFGVSRRRPPRRSPGLDPLGIAL